MATGARGHGRPRRRALTVLLACGVGVAGGVVALVHAAGQPPTVAPAEDQRPARSPADALAAFVLEPGYRIDLVAAEPLVQDPVALAFDARGGLFVVENRGYPDPLEGQPAEAPQGVIARLTDSDGDGRFDRRTEFATGLTYPNGVAVWGRGVFVTVAPDLLYLEDTDDDGVADVRKVALTGFNADRTAQIRFSHPTLGPDGWLYLTSGLNGGRVVDPARPDAPPVAFASSDSRYDPRSGAFELVGGQGQYGLTFDDAGHRFICANRHPAWHVVLEPWQLQRNPALAHSQTVQEVSTVGAEAVVWPLTRDLTTASFHPTLMGTPHAGTFTSASGVHVHRGDALVSGHAGSLFIAESAQNLVQRQTLEASGPTFRSRPARQGAEFLASRDSWFRPVFLANGPDGALYVADMYRKDIDHPAYVPEESRRLFDFTAGRGLGRIYRVAASDAPPARLGVDLSRAPASELVGWLSHRNGWWRDTAQRLLVERGEGSVPLLRAASSAGSPLARLPAFWTLDVLGAADESDIARALADQAGAVREAAARVAERRLTEGSGAGVGLVGRPLTMTSDPDPRVRLHVALALGASRDPRVVASLAALARRDGAERWMRTAILTGLHGRAWAFLDAFEARQGRLATTAAVMQDVARLLAATETPQRLVELIARVADPAREIQWQPAALAGIAEGARARGLADGPRSALMTLVGGDTPAARLAHQRLEQQFARARATTELADAPLAQRLAAIDLLAHADWPRNGPALLALLGPREASPLQLAAVRALARMRDDRAASGLLAAERWAAATPRVREVVLTELLADARGLAAVLDALEAGRLSAAAIGPARARRLSEHRDDTVRTRARRLFGALDAQAGRKAFERLRGPVASTPGDPSRGVRQFAEQCAVCHTFAGQGGRVGPDLSGIRNQPVEALLLHVLVPDYEITPGYETYAAQTRDGRALHGRLESETATSITLRDATGAPHVVLRSALTSLTASPASLMPSTFHEVLSTQDLADLIAYLKQR